MGQSVYVLPLEAIEKMKMHYQKSLQTTPQGSVFRAKTHFANTNKAEKYL